MAQYTEETSVYTPLNSNWYVLFDHAFDSQRDYGLVGFNWKKYVLNYPYTGYYSNEIETTKPTRTARGDAILNDPSGPPWGPRTEYPGIDPDDPYEPWPF